MNVFSCYWPFLVASELRVHEYCTTCPGTQL